MKKADKKGFTLIELLVVISIIGLLASIVLVSVQGARNRAKDARIMSDMGQIRSVAEVFLGNNSTYTGLGSNSDEDTLASDIGAQGGSYNIYINANGTKYCAVSSLLGGGYWCVDADLRSAKDANGTLASCVVACAAANTCRCDN